MAYDIGWGVHLSQAEQLIAKGTTRSVIAPRHRAPKHFAYGENPLRLELRSPPLTFGSYRSDEEVGVHIFDFGAVSLTYTIPFSAPLSDLLELSDALYDNRSLQDDASSRLEELVASIRPAVQKPITSDAFEDYVIFQVSSSRSHLHPSSLLATHREQIAQILRAEKLELAEQEITEAISDSLSYTPDDLLIINWNSAFIAADDASDIRSVLETANVQLLEFRHLDRALDRSLDDSYRLLNRKRARTPFFGSVIEEDLSKLAELQVDSAVLFEGISNAIKLLGDQYLSRVYRTVARRFHLSNWDGAIVRKLSTIESIYEKLSDQLSTRRMEVLELIIILLIVISIALPFVTGVH